MYAIELGMASKWREQVVNGSVVPGEIAVGQI